MDVFQTDCQDVLRICLYKVSLATDGSFGNGIKGVYKRISGEYLIAFVDRG